MKGLHKGSGEKEVMCEILGISVLAHALEVTE